MAKLLKLISSIVMMLMMVGQVFGVITFTDVGLDSSNITCMPIPRNVVTYDSSNDFSICQRTDAVTFNVFVAVFPTKLETFDPNAATAFPGPYNSAGWTNIGNVGAAGVRNKFGLGVDEATGLIQLRTIYDDGAASADVLSSTYDPTTDTFSVAVVLNNVITPIPASMPLDIVNDIPFAQFVYLSSDPPVTGILYNTEPYAGPVGLQASIVGFPFQVTGNWDAVDTNYRVASINFAYTFRIAGLFNGGRINRVGPPYTFTLEAQSGYTAPLAIADERVAVESVDGKTLPTGMTDVKLAATFDRTTVGSSVGALGYNAGGVVFSSSNYVGTQTLFVVPGMTTLTPSGGSPTSPIGTLAANIGGVLQVLTISKINGGTIETTSTGVTYAAGTRDGFRGAGNLVGGASYTGVYLSGPSGAATSRMSAYWLLSMVPSSEVITPVLYASSLIGALFIPGVFGAAPILGGVALQTAKTTRESWADTDSALGVLGSTSSALSSGAWNLYDGILTTSTLLAEGQQVYPFLTTVPAATEGTGSVNTLFWKRAVAELTPASIPSGLKLFALDGLYGYIFPKTSAPVYVTDCGPIDFVINAGAEVACAAATLYSTFQGAIVDSTTYAGGQAFIVLFFPGWTSITGSVFVTTDTASTFTVSIPEASITAGVNHLVAAQLFAPAAGITTPVFTVGSSSPTIPIGKDPSTRQSVYEESTGGAPAGMFIVTQSSGTNPNVGISGTDISIGPSSTTPEFSPTTLLIAVLVAGAFIVFVVRRRRA